MTAAPMAELRRDPIVDRWVILAEKRALRPNEFQPPTGRPASFDCPFCAGHEQQTPAEVLAYRKSSTPANGPGWQLRVVPNKYPALEPDDPGSARRGPLIESLPGVGGHEVIIPTPRHIETSGQMTDAELADALRAGRDRLRYWAGKTRGGYGLWFQNVGETAGASLRHLHSQLIVLPIVPQLVRQELDGSRRLFQQRGRCVFCDMLDQTGAAETNVVLATAEFIVLCPSASRFPYEMWILPQRHASHFNQIDRPALRQLAATMRPALSALERTLQHPAYNVLLHTAPFDTQALPHYHWHMEILPRVSRMAGFELGTGFTINPVPPDRAARQLKEGLF